MLEESLLKENNDECILLLPAKLNTKGQCVKVIMTGLGLLAYVGEFLFSKFTQNSVYLGLKEVHRVLSGDYPDDSTDDVYNKLSYVLASMDYVTNISLIDLKDGTDKFLESFPGLFVGGRTSAVSQSPSSIKKCLQVFFLSALPRLAMFVNYTTGGLTNCIPLSHWLKDTPPELRYSLMVLTVASTIDYYLLFSYVDVLESAAKFKRFRQSAMYRLWGISKVDFSQRFIQSFIITNTFRFSTFAFVGQEAAKDVFEWPEGATSMMILCGMGAWLVSAFTRMERLFEKSIKPLQVFAGDDELLQQTRYQVKIHMRPLEKIWTYLSASKFGLIRGLAYGGITAIYAEKIGAFAAAILPPLVGIPLFYQSFSSDRRHLLNCQAAKYFIEQKSCKKDSGNEGEEEDKLKQDNCIDQVTPYVAGFFNTVSQVVRGFCGFLFMWNIFKKVIPNEMVVFLMVVAIALELGITNGSYFQPKAEKVIKGWLHTLFGRCITAEDPADHANENILTI
jgi:hypothetical protein